MPWYTVSVLVKQQVFHSHHSDLWPLGSCLVKRQAIQMGWLFFIWVFFSVRFSILLKIDTEFCDDSSVRNKNQNHESPGAWGETPKLFTPSGGDQMNTWTENKQTGTEFFNLVPEEE